MVTEVFYSWGIQSVTLADTPLARDLTISQIKITGDEFLVLRNATNTNLQLSNYWLQYFNDFDLTKTSSASSFQLPSVWLTPSQSIMLSVGTAAACGPVWVSKLSFTLKDSAGMLQIVGMSQTSGIVGYKPQDQVSWSSKTSDPVDLKGISSSAAAQIYYRTDKAWLSAATPPGCTASSTSTSPATNTPDTLTSTNTSPPSILLSESDEASTISNIPIEDIGLIAPQLSEIVPNPGPPKTDANDEYIELYNPNDKPFDLSGFKLQSGGSSTYTFPDGEASLQPHEFKSFYASKTNLTLPNTAGEVKFLSPTGEILAQSDAYADAQDDYGWILADGLWQWTKVSTPNARNIITTETSTSVLGSNQTVRPPVSRKKQSYAPLTISEILPNPKSPQTDAENEFIEIYNPNSKAVKLAGYILLTGMQDNHRYTFKNGSIGPGSYIAFYSSTTHLTLSNNEGRAKLLAPNNSQIDATGDYVKAPDGQSWIYAAGKWQWSTTPTPGKPNIFVASTTNSANNTSANRSSAANGQANAAGRSENKSNPLHPLILAGIGGTVLLYALYEYRHDLANQFYRLRRNRAAGRAAGQITQ